MKPGPKKKNQVSKKLAQDFDQISISTHIKIHPNEDQKDSPDDPPELNPDSPGEATSVAIVGPSSPPPPPQKKINKLKKRKRFTPYYDYPHGHHTLPSGGPARFCPAPPTGLREERPLVQWLRLLPSTVS